MTLPAALPAIVLPILAAITFAPDPIAFQIGPLPVYWYGLAYMVGLAATYFVITREARRRGLDARLVDNGIIVVAVAALAGGRLYHVIDQWALYKDNLASIVLPPYTGLGAYGGIVTGTIAAWLFTRWQRQPFWKWGDVIVPGVFVMQAIGRWGNFFNQELYGPPTNLPWGIAIQCENRVAAWACAQYPEATTAFHPLFLYESVSGLLGAVTLLWLARRFGSRLRPGDLALLFFAWYAVVRFALEPLRTGNWMLNGIPVAMLVSTAVVVVSLGIMAWRHRPGAADGDRWDDAPAGDDDDWDEEGYDAEDIEDIEADADPSADPPPVRPAG